ncbi:MAG: esterase-like activity of phytase family protein [Opitutales bacterium]|nr:esterase-like activity of phytase family protein [Opitutales bacterium]MCH8541117.1 esterase-like activity of phytase family protein [Opitutales bacterium]
MRPLSTSQIVFLSVLFVSLFPLKVFSGGEWEEWKRFSWPTGYTVEGVTLKGLSGITFDPEKGVFHTISDGKGVGEARVFTLSPEWEEGLLTGMKWTGVIGLTLRGKPFPPMDGEGIALDHRRGWLYVANEGFASSPSEYGRYPWVAKFDWPGGEWEQALPLPNEFMPRDARGNRVPPGDKAQVAGVRKNLGPESLGLSPDGQTLFTANEAALKQDYEGSYDFRRQQAQNTLVRVVKFGGVPERPKVLGQRAYRTDPGARVLFVPAFNTLSALEVMDDRGRLLMLERGVQGPVLATGNFRIRLYEVDFADSEATDISALSALAGESIIPLSKRLVWEGTEGMDNLEGVARGPEVEGRKTLFLVSDNNSNAQQETQVIVLRQKAEKDSREN